MKNKFKEIIFFLFFIFCFVVFYKGLNNSNIYTPNIKVEKKIPFFKAKDFNSNIYMDSEKIFEENKYFIVTFGHHGVFPV